MFITDDMIERYEFASKITRVEFGWFYYSDKILADVREANDIQKERLTLIEKAKRLAILDAEAMMSNRLRKLLRKQARAMARKARRNTEVEQ